MLRIIALCVLMGKGQEDGGEEELGWEGNASLPCSSRRRERVPLGPHLLLGQIWEMVAPLHQPWGDHGLKLSRERDTGRIQARGLHSPHCWEAWGAPDAILTWSRTPSGEIPALLLSGGSLITAQDQRCREPALCAPGSFSRPPERDVPCYHLAFA